MTGLSLLLYFWELHRVKKWERTQRSLSPEIRIQMAWVMPRSWGIWTSPGGAQVRPDLRTANEPPNTSSEGSSTRERAGNAPVSGPIWVPEMCRLEVTKESWGCTVNTIVISVHIASQVLEIPRGTLLSNLKLTHNNVECKMRLEKKIFLNLRVNLIFSSSLDYL